MIKVITHKDCLTTRSQRSKEKLQRPNSPKQGRSDRHSSPHNSNTNTNTCTNTDKTTIEIKIQT